MESPFRDDDEAARGAIDALRSEQARLDAEVTAAEGEIARLRARRWITVARVAILATALATSCSVGYRSSVDVPRSRCGEASRMGDW